MIVKAVKEDLAELRELWKICFPDEDPGFLEFFGKNRWDPSYCYVSKEDGKIVSYLRYFKGEGDVIQIGRVVSRIRKHGYASAVLAKAIAQIKEMPGISAIVLEAQVYAVTFYEKAGFVVVSEPFDEDGIMHVRMERTLIQA